MPGPSSPLRVSLLLEEGGVLIRVARLRLEDKPVRRNAERGEQRLGPLGLAVSLIENAGIAAGEGDFGFRVAAGKDRGLDHPLRRLVQRGRLPRAAHEPVFGAAENDEAGGRRRRVEIGARKPVLERQDQRIAERRETGDAGAGWRRS